MHRICTLAKVCDGFMLDNRPPCPLGRLLQSYLSDAFGPLFAFLSWSTRAGIVWGYDTLSHRPLDPRRTLSSLEPTSFRLGTEPDHSSRSGGELGSAVHLCYCRLYTTFPYTSNVNRHRSATRSKSRPSPAPFLERRHTQMVRRGHA
jgi:hypothetical protein